MKIKRIDGSIIWSGDAATVKDAIEKIFKLKISLSGIDLSGIDLSGSNLSGRNLSGSNLYGIDLSRSNLSRSNLSGSDLSGSDLSGSDLSGSDLSGSDLSGSNLSGSNLSGSDLSGSKLSRSNLSGSDLSLIQLAGLRIIPTGDVIGWKKCKGGVLVKLLVPEAAKRSNAPSGRKCRAEFVKVLEVIGGEVGISQHDRITEYKVGETVCCDRWSEDWWVECAGGIHFFITREEAEAY